MSSRIEQIIEEIEEYVDSCKYQPLSTTKIVVNKEEIEELLRELRLKTPDEIKRYQKIISNKDAILEDAQNKADAIIADAQARAQEMVTQHEIMQKAYQQANETINAANKEAQDILDSATQDANAIRYSAITYTDDMMASIENILTQTLNDAGVKYKMFIDAVQDHLNVVNSNRQELAPQAAAAQAAAMSSESTPSYTPEELDLQLPVEKIATEADDDMDDDDLDDLLLDDLD
ncbi:MAG: ATPase [Clostridiales bacterium]|nr:ATPase [Candidatus Blautia equi]